MLTQHTSRALRSAFASKRASLSPKQAPSTRTLLQIAPKRPFSFQSTRPQIPSQYNLLHKTNPATRRPFTSTHSSNFGNQNRYNRFGGGTRQPLVFRLVQNAKPGHFVAIGVGISGVYLYNTDTVEMTGRRRFNCVSSSQELKMGEESYREVLQSERGKVLPDYHPLTRMVDGVLRRLIPQAAIEGANWKVHVIKDDGMANAFVLPGGKVFVYTGILPICKDEDGLAAVLGHEIAHVVAHHPAERMSNSFITLGAVLALSFLFDVSGQLSSMLLNLMYRLPNSRTQEAEADNIGLMMMSKACFNPEAAVSLWARMQEQEKQTPPQFMSTHPSSYNRMEAIQGWLTKAEGIYEENGCSSLKGYMPGFRSAYDSMAHGLLR